MIVGTSELSCIKFFVYRVFRFMYLQKQLRVFRYFKKSFIFVYIRVLYFLKIKKVRKVEFQFTHYKQQFEPKFSKFFGDIRFLLFAHRMLH